MGEKGAERNGIKTKRIGERDWAVVLCFLQKIRQSTSLETAAVVPKECRNGPERIGQRWCVLSSIHIGCTARRYNRKGKAKERSYASYNSEKIAIRETNRSKKRVS